MRGRKMDLMRIPIARLRERANGASREDRAHESERARNGESGKHRGKRAEREREGPGGRRLL